MAETRETVPLAAFLADLPKEEAGELRAAAAEIDALEREIGPPNWIERNLMSLGALALLLFVAGIAGFFGGIGGGFGLGTAVLLMAAFPMLVFAYLYSVRGQTRLDDAKMALNEKHFLARGGVYFGAAGGEGSVMLVEPPKTGPEAEPDLRSKIHAQYEEATKRKLW